MMQPTEQSPPLTLRPNIMACQSSETHVSSAVLYQSQHFEGGGIQGTAGSTHVLDDPNGHAMTLLRNVESVYFQSMSSEDEMKKMRRDKLHAEEHARRLGQDKEDLLKQLQQEKAMRTCVPCRT